MKRRMAGIWALLLMLALAPGALAGYNEMIVCTAGHGVAVYAKPGGKQAGILYNGFSCALSLEDTDGLYKAWLTSDYTVYVNQQKAEKNVPAYNKRPEGWKNELQSSAWMAAVSRADAPVYGTPGTKKKIATHAVGTEMKVWGEFGDYYYVDTGSLEGFMKKGDLCKRYDLPTYAQASKSQAELSIGEAIVYTGGRQLAACGTATGYCANPLYAIYRDGQQVSVRAYVGDWAQLTDGSFLERRFLDPAGDHSRAFAVVQTDGPLNRLNVRYSPESDSSVVAKLCAGARVEVVSQTENWANIFYTGDAGGLEIKGCVKKEFLAFGAAAEKVQSACQQARLASDSANGQAGEIFTLVGVDSGFDITQSGQGDQFLALNAQGELLYVDNTGGVLAPLQSAGLFAKVSADSVRLRETPDTESRALRTLSQGAKPEVLLRGEGWTLVRYKDQTGYVMSRYLRFP